MTGRAKAGTYPNRIRELRNERSMTLEQLAEKMRTTHPTIQRIESGSIQLTHRKILAFAAALDCHPGELFAPIRAHEDPAIGRAIEVLQALGPEEREAWLHVGSTMSRPRPAPKPAAKPRTRKRA